MALQLRNLSTATYANGWTQWHYQALGDSMQDVMAEGYFHDARDIIKRGDVGFISCRDGVMQVAFGTNGTFTPMVGALHVP